MYAHTYAFFYIIIKRSKDSRYKYFGWLYKKKKTIFYCAIAGAAVLLIRFVSMCATAHTKLRSASLARVTVSAYCHAHRTTAPTV